jgi:endonuclease/exonuclease/phosphatase family metal-dependent hydrolase
VLLVYSVHFKSNRGELQADIATREEAARQVLAHATEMERLYSRGAKVITVIAGDFKTDPTDPRFASEQTFSLLRQNFEWAWEDVPLSERVTLPANGRYPDASFDGFFIRGTRALSREAIRLQGISDHFPVIVSLSVEQNQPTRTLDKDRPIVPTARGHGRIHFKT